jgi:hypothetical protein
MVDVRHPNTAREIPLSLVAAANRLSTRGSNRRREVVHFDFLPSIPNLAIAFQVSHVASRFAKPILFAMNVIQVLRAAEIAVKREVSGNISLCHPVDQLPKQNSVILELLTLRLALITLLEDAKLQRIVFPAAANVVDEEIVVSNLVALFCVVPNPADILDQLSIMIDQHVVDGDDAVIMILRGRILLEHLQPTLVQRFGIPIHFSNETIPARLIGRHGELGAHAANVLLSGDHQANEVLRDMPTLRIIAKQVVKIRHRLAHDRREINDFGHHKNLHHACAPLILQQEILAHFLAA